MPDLTPYIDSIPDRRSRQVSRAIARLEQQTTMRLANVQAESIVQAEKLHEMDHLAREAITGQALLRRWADTLAAGDPLVAEELRLFSDLARMAKGEIITDTLATYCRESRR